MSHVRSFRLNSSRADTCHQGFSSLLGYRTRVFTSIEDAWAELEWLDGKWRELLQLVAVDQTVTHSSVFEQTRERLRGEMRKAGRGMVPMAEGNAFGVGEVAWRELGTREERVAVYGADGELHSLFDKEGFRAFVEKRLQESICELSVRSPEPSPRS